MITSPPAAPCWRRPGRFTGPVPVPSAPSLGDSLKPMDQPNLLPDLSPPPPKRRSRLFNPKEFKVVALRECPTLEDMQTAETPDKAAAYWRANIPTDRYFNPAVECFITLLVNTRRRILGHN